MKKVSFSLFFVLAALFVKAQSFQWARSTGASYTDRGSSIDVDTSGNVYTCGFFSGVVDFDPGVGVFNLTASIMTESIFVQKMNSAGAFVHAFNFGVGTASKIKVDKNGNIYVVGFFSDTADFDPGPSVMTLITQGGSDIFIAKFDNSGLLKWAKSLGSTSPDAALSVAVDSIGNVYTSGYFHNTVDFDPGNGVFNLTANGPFSDLFVLKLDSSSQFQWAIKCDGTSFDEAKSIAIDNAGYLHITGTFMNTVDFDPGPNNYFLTSSGARDVFALKLDNAGNFIWARAIGGLSHDLVYGISSDLNGNSYLVGRYTDSADFDPGATIFKLFSMGLDDIFILKLNTAGNLDWAKSIGGTGGDYAKSIFVDHVGNVFTVGQFNGVVDFDPGATVFNLGQPSTAYVFLLKLNSLGQFGWAKKIGDPGAAQALVEGIVGDNLNNLYTTGYYSLTMDFDPDPGVYNLTSLGSSDVFLQKYNHCGSTTVLNSTGCDSLVYFGNVYTQSGTYTHQFTNSNGCDSVVVLNLVINQLNASIAQSGASLVASPASAVYQWLNCEPFSNILGQTSQTYSPSSNGYYAVVISQNGCIDTSMCFPMMGLGYEGYSFEDELLITPNPTSDFIEVDLGKNGEKANLAILNALGQTLYQNSLTGTGRHTVDLSSFKAGIYVVILEQNNKRVLNRVLKK